MVSDRTKSYDARRIFDQFMRFRISMGIVGILSLLVLTVPALVHITSQPDVNPNLVSYNPPPAQNFHAPISDMGLVGIANQTSAVLTIDTSSHVNDSSATGVEPIHQNALRFTTDISYSPQTETTIVVDPNNPSHILGGFNDQKFLVCRVIRTACIGSIPGSGTGFTISTDGGKSIAKSDDLPSVFLGPFLYNSFGDPSAAATTDGNFFFSTVAFSIEGFGVLISKSNSSLFDPSVSCNTLQLEPTSNPCWHSVLIFPTQSFTPTMEDKPLLAVDRDLSSPFFGSVYVAWDHFFDDGTSASYMARCTSDLSTCVMVSGGDQPVLSGRDLFVSFTTPVVDKNGAVHVAWCNYGTFVTFGPVLCRIRSSPPGATSFGPVTTIFSFMGAGTTLPRDTVTIGWATEQFRTASIPFLAVDMSPKTNNLYFAIQACSSGHYYVIRSFFARDTPGDCGLSDVLFSVSTDGGSTWSFPTNIANPAVNDQPFVTVDPVTGHVFVFYYTTQYDPFNHRIDVVASMSSTGGNRFKQIRLTTVSNEPDADPNMYFYFSPAGGALSVPEYGDYFQAVASGGTLWVLFTANYAPEVGTFQTDPFLLIVGGL